VSRKKQKQQIEEEAVDKMDLFLANNYKKLLSGLAVLLVVFLAGYAFKNMNQSKSSMMANKAGQLEMLVMLSQGDKEQVGKFLEIGDEYPKFGAYVNLKAAELLISADKRDEAAAPLNNVEGDLKELADGLKFDTGLGDVNQEQYLSGSKMTALWYYRAYLAADGDKKQEIMEAFKNKYPENELYKQIERWNG